jgi:menaquinone-dependent protoporphyrinogen IX oxidase
MTAKVLVAYQTKEGASELYAGAIAGTMKAKGFDVDLVDLKKAKPDIRKYEIIIVGAGVKISLVYGKWKSILKKKELADKKLAMFLTSGTAIEEPDKAINKYVQPIIDKYKLKPIAVGSFPGKVPEKFAEKDIHKNAVKSELASAWAEKLAQKIEGGI